jgi:signal transduction histidine kinase
MTRTVLLADNRRAALTMVAARACEAAHGDLGAVFVRDKVGDEVDVSVANWWPGEGPSALNPSAALVATFLANADMKPTLVDISSHSHLDDLPPAFRKLGSAMMCRAGPSGHSRGVVLVARRAGAQPFAESDLRLLPPYAAEAGLAIAFAEARRELERWLLARDRSRIARELHDGVIQSLFGIGMVIEGIKGDARDSAIRDQLQGITGSINLIIDDLRAYIHDLTPTRLAKLGLGSELCALAQEFQAGSGIAASVRLREGVDEIKAGLARDLMQISREALSNVAQHASASSVVLSLGCSAHGVNLEIADDGTWVGARKRAGGRGLANIRRRALAWGGTVEIGTSKVGGTAVRVAVPGRGVKQSMLQVSIA